MKQPKISCTSQHEVQARNGGVALRTGTDHVMLVSWERANIEKGVEDTIVRMTPKQARDTAAWLTAYADFMEKSNGERSPSVGKPGLWDIYRSGKHVGQLSASSRQEARDAASGQFTGRGTLEVSRA